MGSSSQSHGDRKLVQLEDLVDELVKDQPSEERDTNLYGVGGIEILDRSHGSYE